ncbi:MAG: hypothetical protein QF744_15010 [SAR202 cluster bacterium]|jgi:hypothetical protein|nr:hypothetical protein [SAR202 cluster bacterium]
MNDTSMATDEDFVEEKRQAEDAPTLESEVDGDAAEAQAEIEARELGWRPQEEWSGDTSRWMPASEFMERNERLKGRGDGILQAENRKLAQEISALKDTVAGFSDHMQKVEKRSFQRAFQELSEQRREAVEAGDVEAFDQVQTQMVGLQKEVAEAAPAAPAGSPDDDPGFTNWLADNDWYNADVTMTMFANQAAPIVGRKTGLSPADGRAFYDAVTEEVRLAHPEKFSNPRRQRAATVENGGGATTGGGGKSKGQYSKLPPEAKEACATFTKQGLYEDTPQGREKYADIYFNG